MKNIFNLLHLKIKGLSLLELLLTMILISIAASVVIPVGKIYVTQQREDGLKSSLAAVRSAITKYYEVELQYPVSIDIMLQKKYLRRMELEPFGNSWEYVPYTGTYAWKSFVETSTGLSYITYGISRVAQGTDKIFDVRSSTAYTGMNGIVYTAW
jgi:general secretion pathway protein G